MNLVLSAFISVHLRPINAPECKFFRKSEFSASVSRLELSRSVGEPSGARPSAGAAVEALPTFPRSKRKRCHPNDGTRKPTHGCGWEPARASRREPGVERCELQPRPPRCPRPARL